MASITDSLSSHPSSPNIRPFDAYRDLRSVADLIEICFADTLDPDGEGYIQRMRAAASSPNMLRWAATSTEWNRHMMTGFVWDDGSRLVGNLSIIPYTVQGKRRFLIANVAVHPDYRRRGIARQLTNHAVAYARQRGVPEVWLHVREENEPAVTLYRELAFAERARRTTWHSLSDYPRAPLPPELIFGKRRSADWGQQQRWLQQNYPPEVTWNLPFQLNAMRPGLFGTFSRVFNNIYLQQWSVQQRGQLQGTVAWQASATFANILWLAAAPDTNDEAVQGLLVHARRQVPTRRPLALDYPAGQSSTAIQTAGFKAYQTLIWMAIVF